MQMGALFNKSSFFIFLLGLSLTISSHTFAVDSSIKDFGRLPFVKDVQISPDGEYMAYFQERDGRYLLVTRRLDGKEKPKVLDIPKRNLTGFTWVGQDRIFVKMFTTKYVKAAKEKHTFWRAGIYDVTENEMIWPFNASKFKFNLSAPKLANKLENDPNHILINNYSTFWNLGIYATSKNKLIKLNIRDGSWKILEADKFRGNLIADANGMIRLAFARMEGEENLVAYYRSNEEEDFKPLWIVENGERVPFTNTNIDFDDEGQHLYFHGSDEDKKRVIRRAEIDDQNTVTSIKTMFGLDKYDADGFSYSYSSLLVNGVNYTKDYSDTYYFDKEIAQVQADLKATFPSATVSITSYDSKKERWIAQVSGADYGIEYYFYDQKNVSIALLASAYPKYEPSQGGAVKRFDYVTQDETPIDAYLTLPRRKTGKKPPLIVMPHGGPEDRDDMSFYWQRQFFATHGYAVFQPNFRGSSGYGRKFAESGYREWGKKMQSDVNEGVHKLIKQGLVDEKNICIVGGSYGGYTAMIGATHHYDQYQCAISYGGVTFLEGMFHHSVKQKMGFRYWTKSIGDRFSLDELRAYSPLFSITEKSAPMLIIHGENDTIVPPYHAERMRKTFKSKGIRGNKVIIIDDADHWFTAAHTRKEFLEESLKFLNKHIDK